MKHSNSNMSFINGSLGFLPVVLIVNVAAVSFVVIVILMSALVNSNNNTIVKYQEYLANIFYDISMNNKDDFKSVAEKYIEKYQLPIDNVEIYDNTISSGMPNDSSKISTVKDNIFDYNNLQLIKGDKVIGELTFNGTLNLNYYHYVAIMVVAIALAFLNTFTVIKNRWQKYIKQPIEQHVSNEEILSNDYTEASTLKAYNRVNIISDSDNSSVIWKKIKFHDLKNHKRLQDLIYNRKGNLPVLRLSIIDLDVDSDLDVIYKRIAYIFSSWLNEEDLYYKISDSELMVVLSKHITNISARTIKFYEKELSSKLQDLNVSVELSYQMHKTKDIKEQSSKSS